MKNILFITGLLSASLLIPDSASGRSKADGHEDRRIEDILGFDTGDTCMFYGERNNLCQLLSSPLNHTCWTYKIERGGILFTIGQREREDYDINGVIDIIKTNDPSLEIDDLRVGDVITDKRLLDQAGNKTFICPRPYPMYSFSDSEMTGHNDTIIFVALSDKWFAKVNKRDMTVMHFEKNMKFDNHDN